MREKEWSRIMAASTMPARSSVYDVFRNRSFSLMWSGQLISTIGSALTSLAASILVYRQTGSALSVGLMLMATALPSLAVGLVAGVFVDRYNRKAIMIAADLVRAVLALLIPVLVPFSIAWLYVMVLLSSAATQFFDPAHESVLPEVASQEELARATSLMAISSFGATSVGFALSGLIASRLPIAWAFYLDSLSFVLSALCLARVRIAPLGVDDRTTVAAVAANLRAGARFLFETPILRALFLISIPVFVSFGLSNSLLLPFALRALHADTFAYGLQEGLTSVGFVVASLLMAGLADRLHLGQWVAISFLGMAVAGIAYALSTSVPVAIAILTISGFLNAPSSIARTLIIQRNTPREMRGRVSSSYMVTRNVVFLVGMAAAGLADVIDVRVLYVAANVLLLGAGLLALGVRGLGLPAAEWRQTLRLLRSAQAAPHLGLGRVATLADVDLLAGRLPALARLSGRERQALAHGTRVAEAPIGTAIVQQGEISDDAYFILEGRVVAGIDDGPARRELEVLQAGDFFGEIAALTGVPRTASVIAEQPTTILKVPATTLRTLMKDPLIAALLMTTMTERMVRLNMIDLPRFATFDQEALRALRTPEPPTAA